ncbi:unnamed protein product, partial [Musa acuminata subsp. burmannicoides]
YDYEIFTILDLIEYLPYESLSYLVNVTWRRMFKTGLDVYRIVVALNVERWVNG